MVHGLSHGVVTWIRTIEVCYVTQVVLALCYFDLASIWHWVTLTLCLR